MGIDGRGANQPLDIAQCLTDAQGQPQIAEQLATTVVEAVSREGEDLSAGDFVALADHSADVIQDEVGAVIRPLLL